MLFGVGLAADRFLTYAPSFPYADTLLSSFSLPRSLYSWANFDGVHYLTIAQSGYRQVRFIQAFFPLLPIFITVAGTIFGTGVLLGGLLVTNAMALVAILTWFVFLKTFFDVKTAWLGTFVLLLFPTSFFLGALYTESLFLCLVLAAFLCAHHKKWALATAFTMLATSTRIVGIFLVPALILEAWQQKSKSKILLVLLGSLGLLIYMVYLHRTVGDPLAFFHAQSAFGAGRQTNLVLYPQVVWRAFKILITNPVNLKYIAYFQEFVAGTLGLLGLVLVRNYVRRSWLVFALGAFLLPPLTGTFSSMGRYLLVCFPLFIFLAKTLREKPRWRFLWFVVSATLLAINTLLFIQGYWVA